MKSVNFNVEITLNNIIWILKQRLNPHEMVEFIKDLDENFANWDTTEKLYKYFRKQHQIYERNETKRR